MTINALKITAQLSISMLLMMVIPVAADTISYEDAISWVEGGKVPQPQVMVSGYTITPDALMPGDEAILTVRLENTQEDPIDGWKRGLRSEWYEGGWQSGKGKTIVDADITKTLTMDAYVKKAYISGNDVVGDKSIKVYNEYSKVGVIGPGKELDLSFKIVAPDKGGIYMVKFYAEIEGVDGTASKEIRYQIPLIVSSTVELIPLSVPSTVGDGSVIKMEVANTGLGDASSITVISDADDVKFEVRKVYVGTLKAGESSTAEFTVKNVSGTGQKEATFRATYKNGINEHESDPLSLTMKPVTKSNPKNSGLINRLLEYVFMIPLVF
ncbi:MAG: CARDB domain-containing protein [Halobacteriota archaeon]|nr:CARDB domain-containing protein [Halobacteriota archaeon]